MMSNETCSWELDFGSPYYQLLSVFYVIIILILFIAIAIVCDDYFVPTLEVICKRLELSEDVAGATFMAAGSSAPELFTSLAAVTNNSDIGVGTIVGSAVFNILVIISLSAVLCKNVLILDWRPLARDAFFYGVSIIIFSVFAWDGKFTWVESLITLCYYFLYILVMKFNIYLFRLMDLARSHAERKFNKHTPTLCVRSCVLCCVTPHRADDPPNHNNKVTVLSEGYPTVHITDTTGPIVHVTPPSAQTCHSEGKTEVKGLGVPMNMVRTHSSGSSGIGSMTDDQAFHTEPENGPVKWVEKTESLDSVCIDDTVKKEHNGKIGEETDAKTPPNLEEEEKEEYDEVTVCCCAAAPKVMTYLPQRPSGRLQIIRQVLNVIYFIVAFPFQLMFSFTIPNSMKPHLKRFYLVSFFMSVLWIAILSYGMVTVVERFGCVVGINDYVMGLVVVAAGTSVPDALSSVIVAREGHGDMAVSNALGSNVFDINLGLGLPFLIKSLYLNGPLILMDDEGIPPGVIKPHSKFGIILFGILVTVFLIISANKFRLNKASGVVFIIIYVMFIVYAIVQELVCEPYTC